MKPLEVVHIAAFLRVPEDEVLRHTVDSTAPLPRRDMLRPGRGRPRASGSSRPTGSPSHLTQEPDRIPIRSGARGGS